LTEKRQKDIELAGAYRAPIASGGRSFKPRFGKLQEMASFTPGGQYVVDTKGNKNLLKMARPAEVGSGEAQGALTVPTKKVVVRGPQTTGNTAMTKKIPLAAGTPLEAPRFRMRLRPRPKAKAVKPASDAKPPEEPRASEGLSSGSSGPNLLSQKGTMSALIAQQKATYVPKRTMAQIQAEARQKKDALAAAKAAETERKRKEKEAAKADLKAFNKAFYEKERAAEKARAAARKS
jgi:hypothetical protein